jgi:hypothetical protein
MQITLSQVACELRPLCYPFFGRCMALLTFVVAQQNHKYNKKIFTIKSYLCHQIHHAQLQL